MRPPAVLRTFAFGFCRFFLGKPLSGLRLPGRPRRRRRIASSVRLHIRRRDGLLHHCGAAASGAFRLGWGAARVFPSSTRRRKAHSGRARGCGNSLRHRRSGWRGFSVGLDGAGRSDCVFRSVALIAFCCADALAVWENRKHGSSLRAFRCASHFRQAHFSLLFLLHAGSV